MSNSNSTEYNLNSNVRMVLDDNYIEDVDLFVDENSWEILNVDNMNTFIFPYGYDPLNPSNYSKNNANNESCWCPSQVDIAIVFQSIGLANRKNSSENIKSTCPSFLKPKDYMSQDAKSGIANRPCGFLTSRGTIMPMPIIPTKNYIQNGLYIKQDNVLKSSDSYTVDKEKYNNCFNWVIPYDIKPPTGTDEYYNKTNDFLELKYYGVKEYTQEGFTFINASNCLNPKEDEKIYPRLYYLDDKLNSNSNNFYKLPSSISVNATDVVEESLIFSGDYGGAFAFCYEFHGGKTEEDDKNRPCINLQINTTNIFIPKVGNIEVYVENNKTDGSISMSKNSQKMGQITEDTFKGNMLLFYPVWNGIAISGGIDDASRVKDSKGTINVTVDNGFVAYKNNDVQMSDFCDPTINSFDTSSPKKMEVKKKSNKERNSVSIQWGKKIEMLTSNCLVSFAYTPVFFQKNLKFSLYIKDNYGRNTPVDVGSSLQSKTRNHYLYPIYFSNDTNYSCPDYVKGVKVVIDNEESNDENDKDVYYRFDLEFCHEQTNSSDNTYPRRGIEIFGFFHRVKVGNTKREIENKNGKISLKPSNNGFSEKFNLNYKKYNEILKISNENLDWIKFATDISVNRSAEQSGGRISLDKYAFLGQFETPPQPVGEIRLKAVGGNKNVYIGTEIEEFNDEESSNDSENSGTVYFTGVGVGMSN